jgi:hypothetical protein
MPGDSVVSAPSWQTSVCGGLQPAKAGNEITGDTLVKALRKSFTQQLAICLVGTAED